MKNSVTIKNICYGGGAFFSEELLPYRREEILWD